MEGFEWMMDRRESNGCNGGMEGVKWMMDGRSRMKRNKKGEMTG
jgi:hypothetical protein